MNPVIAVARIAAPILFIGTGVVNVLWYRRSRPVIDAVQMIPSWFFTGVIGLAGVLAWL